MFPTLIGSVITAFVFQGVALFLIYKYDSKKIPKEQSDSIIIYPNYFGILFIPLIIPLFFAGTVTRFFDWQVGIPLNLLLSSGVFFILIRSSFERYVFTSQGVFLEKKFPERSEFIPINHIQKAVYKKYNDESEYIVECKKKNLKFSSSQMGSQTGFINYLKKAGIPYYEYNLYKDTYTKI